MNTETKNAVANVESNEPSQLITLKPETYVSQVFKPFKDSLKKAIKEAAGIKYDITTTAGMETAKKARALFRAIRLDAEKTRKERKAPIIEIGKLLDSRYRELEAEISPHEDKHDAAIKAEEERKEAEKQRKLAEERARVEAIENRIQNIRNIPLQLSAASSEEVRKAIQQHSDLVLDPADYDEYLEDGINAVNATLVELEKVRVRAVEREEAERKAAAERAELERLRAENEKREKEEADRRAKEEAARREEDERRRKETAAKDAELAAMRAELEAMKRAAMPAPVAAPVVEEKTDVVDAAFQPVAQESAPVIKLSASMVEVKKRPSDEALIHVMIDAVAAQFGTDNETAIGWIRGIDLDSLAEAA